MSITAAHRALSRVLRRPRPPDNGDEGVVRVPLEDWERIVGSLNDYDARIAAALNRASDDVAALAEANGHDITDAVNLVINLTDAYFVHPEWTQDQAIKNVYEEDPDEVRSWV